MKPGKWICGLFAALLLASCGTAARRVRVQPEAPKILPLTDSAEIARSRQRAQIVMDSIARVQSGARPQETPESIRQTAAEPASKALPKELADELLDYARTFLGVPYRLGASGPKLFDCSGFTSYVFREFGFNLPHSSVAQQHEARPVESFADLKKGDLVFFGARNNIRNIGHVGIVTEVDLERGMFQFIHASTSNGVEIQRSTQPYFMMRYMGAGRILPD